MHWARAASLVAGAMVAGGLIAVRYFAARLGLSLDDFDFTSSSFASVATIWVSMSVVFIGVYGTGVWLSYRLIHWLGALNPAELSAVFVVLVGTGLLLIRVVPVASELAGLLFAAFTVFFYGFATTSLFGPLAESPRAISWLFVGLLAGVSLLFGAVLLLSTQSMIDDAEELADHARALAVVGEPPEEPSSIMGFALRPVRGVAVDGVGDEHCVVRVASDVFLTMADDLSGVRTLVMEPVMFMTGWQSCDEATE